MEHIEVSRNGEIQKEQLIRLFVGQGKVKGVTQVNGSLKEEVIRLFEQIISSHRRIEPLRQKLKPQGADTLYKLLNNANTETIKPSRLI